MRINLKAVRGAVASTALAGLLAACGGGGGGDGAGGVTGSTVSGVAATGLAIADGKVSLKCTAGAVSSVTTLADGSYSVDVSAATLPCVVRIEYIDPATGTQLKLHSFAQVAGTVNITPVTDMLVAILSSSGVAADAFDRFDVNEVRTYSEDRIRTAAMTVKTELELRGVDVTHLPDDPIGSELHAANGSHMGDDHDGVLDDIEERLHEQGKTLHELEDEMRSGHETRGLTTSTGQPGDAAAGKTAYEANCQGCHGTRMPDAVNAAKILEAIRENEGGMGFLAGAITTAIADNIATYMANGVGGGTGTALIAQTITFASPGDQMLGVAPPALSATATSGLPVTITSSTPAVCTVSGSTLTLVAAGTCSLSANQSGDASYNAAPTVVNTFTVASAGGVVLTSQTITFVSPGPQQVGTPVSLSASADSGLTVTFASTTPTICTVSGITLTPVAAGNCTITANQAGDSTFAAAATVTRTIAVTNPAVVASAANGKLLYTSNGCGGCHGVPPSNLNVLNGANNPNSIANAIATVGAMSGFSGLTSQNLADIAAYLATPTL